MGRYYDEIMNLEYADNLKNLVKKWKLLSDNLADKPRNAARLLPDMLMVMPTGAGRTTLLRLLSEFLDEQKNLLDFYGDVKFFEFLLSYCPPHHDFTEFTRLMEEVGNAAGFRSEFRGVVSIDISEWLDHFEEKHFLSFLEYLSNNSDLWLIVLTVSSLKEDKLKSLEAFLKMFLRLVTVEINMPQTDILLDYIERKLSEFGISIDTDGRAILYDTLEKLRKQKYFDGYKSVRLLCQDIAYSYFTLETPGNPCLDADFLSAFGSDSEYVDRMMLTFSKQSRIGLLSGGGKDE